jgi:hypothetical protein
MESCNAKDSWVGVRRVNKSDEANQTHPGTSLLAVTSLGPGTHFSSLIYELLYKAHLELSGKQSQQQWS